MYDNIKIKQILGNTFTCSLSRNDNNLMISIGLFCALHNIKAFFVANKKLTGDDWPCTILYD